MHIYLNGLIICLLFLSKCESSQNLIGTIEENGEVYRANNNLFQIGDSGDNYPFKFSSSLTTDGETNSLYYVRNSLGSYYEYYNEFLFFKKKSSLDSLKLFFTESLKEQLDIDTVSIICERVGIVKELKTLILVFRASYKKNQWLGRDVNQKFFGMIIIFEGKNQFSVSKYTLNDTLEPDMDRLDIEEHNLLKFYNRIKFNEK